MDTGDIVFNIYHSKRAPQPPRKDPLGAHGISSPGVNNVQLIDKSWTLGQDYSRGSHITRWPGFYILQWKFHSMPACSATNLPRVDDVLATLQVSSHKCKVMFYTEVLGSEDFRSVPQSLSCYMDVALVFSELNQSLTASHSCNITNDQQNMTLHLCEDTCRVASTSSTRGRLVAEQAGMLWNFHWRM
ncbi:unnamed protein product [Menidia menidia]|uniref:(Atlantic silverside) hypothetical protein n=1 Tax=Menidia menidia TaxID=238744 RepID=A0A8S4BCN8_9TELE|nr:unnamed protein product [Menidia menidia]